MKKPFFVLLLFVLSTFVFAQADRNFDLYLSTGTISLPANYEQVKNQQPTRSDVFQGNYYRYIQFAELPSKTQKEVLEAAGVKIIMYLPQNTYVASIKKGTNLSTLSGPTVRGLHAIKPQYKLLNELKEAIDGNIFPSFAVNGSRVGIGFTYYGNLDHEQVKAYLKSKGYRITFEDKTANWFVVWVKKSRIMNFVSLPFVSSAELVDDEPVPDNNVGRTNIRSNSIATDYSGGRKYNGLGVNIALQDDGRIGPHIDYQGRIPNQFLTTNSGDHGDHCGGTIMGAGNRDPLMKGMAWGSNLHVYSASGYQAFSSITTHYNTLGIRIISTSYSDGCNAGYTTRAQQLDMQNLAMPELIHVFSAGNDGTSNCNYGAGSGWGNVTGGHKHSKNSIAVANLTHLDVRNNSSSRGPAHDGRLKPEVSAVGTNVMSTSDTNRYVPKTGTSMSCPAVAGLFGQLYQAYKNLNSNNNPPSALIKAIVMNTADDLGNPGPDFSFGYGRVNALKAVSSIEQLAYLTSTVSNAGNNSHTITIPAGVRRVKVMTYWHDFQAQVGAGIALVNNLNTTITDPSNTVYNPLILNFTPNATLLNSNAAPGIDNRNNHEQITIDNPTAGNYVLNVNGFSVPMGPQTYYVTWLFEMDGFTVTYPMGGEGFNPGEAETVRWDAFETVGTQTLQYTIDNGNTWNNISASIAGSQRHFNWTPPSAMSGQCRVKVSRGIYSAESDTNFSIIQVPTNLQVAWVCPDSIKLTWNPVAGATAYDVFRLGTTYMDSIATVTNSSVVLSIVPLMQTNWYSVRSRGALNAVSRRAIAVEKKPGLRNCPQVATDVACNKIVNPTGTINDCHNYTNIPVMIELANPGINTLSMVPVYYRINGGPVVSENYSGVLTASTSVIYTFATKASFSGAGTYNIKAWATYGADPISSNDTSLAKLVVQPGAVKTLPLSEDFETFNMCTTGGNCGTTCFLANGFVNEWYSPFDQMDWRTNSGSPPTAGTGPQVDFSTGTAAGKYVYLESSAPCNSLTGALLSPCIDLSSASNPSISFGYHMSGATMGTLYLDIFTGRDWVNAIWSMSGDKGFDWQVANIPLTAWANDTVTFRWRGVTGNGSTSDMAIDGIRLAGFVNTTGVDELNTQQKATVYPNPGFDVFNVVIPFGLKTEVQYTLTDVTGRVILSGKSENKSGQGQIKINLQSYAAGVYTLKLNYNGQTEYTKLYKI